MARHLVRSQWWRRRRAVAAAAPCAPPWPHCCPGVARGPPQAAAPWAPPAIRPLPPRFVSELPPARYVPQAWFACAPTTTGWGIMAAARFTPRPLNMFWQSMFLRSSTGPCPWGVIGGGVQELGDEVRSGEAGGRTRCMRFSKWLLSSPGPCIQDGHSMLSCLSELDSEMRWDGNMRDILACSDVSPGPRVHRHMSWQFARGCAEALVHWPT